MEVSAGAGGLDENFSSDRDLYSHCDAWGGYISASGAIALDPGRHFWIGGTSRWLLANGTYARDRYFMLTGDLTFRF